jgi:hypothetical protein
MTELVQPKGPSRKEGEKKKTRKIKKYFKKNEFTTTTKINKTNKYWQ